MSEKPESETPKGRSGEDLDEAAILRDEQQTERQAPDNAQPGEPAGGE